MLREHDLRALQELTSPACCPACGPDHSCGLECLCRPRFFAGQLLTDEDLRRLDSYIVGKNRLHNRYLHGVGVVCGLEVVCNPCDATVTVRSGYALGPCGEDIVVCEDARVDVAELIRACRRERPKPDCRPYGDRATDDCEAAEQRWILAICYDESPSRGVRPLRDDPRHDCKHGWGDAGGGNGCGCGTEPIRKHKRAPHQCEPTVTCEGYRFVLCKEPPKPKRSVGDNRLEGLLASSELGRKVSACLLKVVSQIRDVPAEKDPQTLAEFCCEWKDDLRSILETGSVHDCFLGSRLADVVCPDPQDPEFPAKISQAFTQLAAVSRELFRSCVCSALLPPCSIGSSDDCVPLATLTVRTADLRVLSICNWSSRQFAITFPTLGYWLGWLPVFDALRNAVTKLCCEPGRMPAYTVNQDLTVRPSVARVRATTTEPASDVGSEERGEGGFVGGRQWEGTVVGTSSKGSAFTRLASQYGRGTSPLSGLDATVLAALGLRGEDDAELASELELANPMTALGLTKLLAPGAASLLPPELTKVFLGLLGREAGAAGTGFEQRQATADEAPPAPPPGPGPGEERLATLEAAFEALRKTVESQRRTINELRRQGRQK
jgi:hypothetical protein